jgi:hypothetical protein
MICILMNRQALTRGRLGTLHDASGKDEVSQRLEDGACAGCLM